MNWRRPLSSNEVIVQTIAATTNTGLTVRAELDDATYLATYPAGIKITDHEMKTLETSHIWAGPFALQG